MKLSKFLFYEVCSYLSSNEVFCILSSICKQWYYDIASSNFLEYWQRERYGISIPLTLKEFINAITRFKDNEIIDYKPWKTNGGESRIK